MAAAHPSKARRRRGKRTEGRAAARATKALRRARHPTRETPVRVISLRRALAKPHVRLVAVDDGRFTRGDRRAPLAAVVMSLPGYVEAVRLGSVEVDGRDATERIAMLIESTGHLADLRAVLLDGVVVGGFNVVDIDRLHDRLRWPIVTVTRRPPDRAKIRAALRKWFRRDHLERVRRIEAHPLFRVPTGGQPIYASVVGAPRRDALALLHRTTVRGYWPEPLRLAHLVASAHSERIVKTDWPGELGGPVA